VPTNKRDQQHDVDEGIARLKKLANKKTRDSMARYDLPSANAFGVPVHAMHTLAKNLGKNHELALALWDAKWYEARMLASFIDEPALVTPVQMDTWCRDFDNWGICDTVCFHLFDRTPHALAKIRKWANRRAEFEKRAAFALLASVASHNKSAIDDQFIACLPLIERAASDGRNFVKKGVSGALRSVGRRSQMLHVESLALAHRLAESDEPAARWIGRDAVRDLSRVRK
jgi:3-methyladenine DNA glycosylase AlkD